MKSMTIWQRLNTAMLLLILLLLTGAALAVWAALAGSKAERRSVGIEALRDRLASDILLVCESLRTVSVEPRADQEKSRLTQLQSELKKDLQKAQLEYQDFPELSAALRNLSDFAQGATLETLGYFSTQVVEATQKDPTSTLIYFNNNYPPIVKQRDTLLGELTKQIAAVKGKLKARALTDTIIGCTGLLLVLLASVLVGRFQTSAIAKPLKRLLTALDRMRQGDFSVRLTLVQKDEFGAVGQGLNHLADDLCELVGHVQRSGIQVNTTATQIAATAKEQQSTAHEIAATTAQIGATSKEISATSRELVKTMNEVNQVAEQTASLAGNGHAAIVRMEGTMRQIIEASSSITSKLAVLSEKTTNINSVVTTITKVADQTNLLSLNAAIEAEKAGEYGLGFAVVATEIRRLADQTAVATYDIEKMVKEMHSAVAAGVMGMDKFSDEVRRGVEEVRQVSAHLAQIINQVQTLTPRFQTVNEGMHAQAAGAQQISETLTQLSEAAQQTAESLRQSNLAIEQLNGAARGLQSSIAHFRLGGQADRPKVLGDGHEISI